GLAAGSGAPAAPTAPPTPPFGLGLALRVAARRLLPLGAGRRHLVRLGTCGRRRGRPGLAWLVGPATTATTAATAALFFALLFRSGFARRGRDLGDLLLFVFLLDQGWRLDRAQGRRLAGGVRAQPLQAEARRDQRIVLCD